LVIVLILVLCGAGGAFFYTKATTVKDYAQNTQGAETLIKIEQGAIASEVADLLEGEGVIQSAKVFLTVVKANPNLTIPSGEFLLYQHMSAQEAFDRLQDPDAIATKTVTIPEGKTVAQTLTILADKLDLSEAELKTTLQGLTDKLPKGVESPEGWLFPDTYTFSYEDDNASNVLTTLISATTKALDKAGVTADQYEAVLTKASIVQKEVISTADMAKAARVIENRLENDMVLGMDTIVSYGVNKGSGESSLELLQTDLDDETSPYNARKQKGLPPTPISNPGLEAIEAVMHPTEGDWLWFITIDPSTGKTDFFNTEADFEAAKVDYKAWCADNPDVCGL
jgi:UPF0755 protein